MDRSPCNDLASSLVQEVATSLAGQQVPDKYVHKDVDPPAEDRAIADDLLIDFSRLSDKDELAKFRATLFTWGCVQLVNHGMEAELLQKVLDVIKQFFALPLEEKKKSYGALAMFNGYGSDGALREDRPRNWNDGLYLRLSTNDPADLRFWPETPSYFRKTLGELDNKIQLIPEVIFKAMAYSLDLKEDCLLSHHGLKGGFYARLNLYPQCPNPDKVLGVTPHTDGTTFTLLLQDQHGLEIMANDRWFKVPVIPGAIFLNVGDFVEIMSNGVIKSTLHRVVASSEKERVSLAVFYHPDTLKEIGPVREMISIERPQLYDKINMIEHGKLKASSMGKPIFKRCA